MSVLTFVLTNRTLFFDTNTLNNQDTVWSFTFKMKATQCTEANVSNDWLWCLIMTRWETLMIETSAAAASLHAPLRLSLSLCSVIIPAVKSLLSPPIFVHAELAVCCKFQAQRREAPCSSIHYSETHREPASKDAFSVLKCWTFTDCSYYGFTAAKHKKGI